jgi:ATP-dependent helicase/nuclease subunit B
MKTVLGPFHPHLERALVDELRRHKADHPLLPVLILVPSDVLRRRLKILLTREQNLSWINLHLMTFHQLSFRLSSEANGMHSPVLHDDLFLEEVLRQIIRTRQPGTEAFVGIEERVGGCAALWQTLRDLRDGLVEPSVVLEALREDHFAKATSERTSHLLALLETLLFFCKQQGIEDHSDLDQWTTARIPSSRFLDQFMQIFYYGFYDLTQVQVDLFHAVSQNYPTSLFFPLVQTQPKHDGWCFAEHFYQRYVQGRIGETTVTNLVEQPARKNLPATFRLFDQTAERPYAPLPKKWRCKIINAFGTHDEVAVVAKEILRLVADERMSFDEMGVVARSLETYGPVIKEIFHNHRIPLTGMIEEALVQFPLTKAVILLLNLPAKDYLRTQVIDLLSSPYFQHNFPGAEKILARPDMWDLATRELAICNGIQEWRRLESYTTRDLILSRISNDDEPRVVKIAAAQIRCLANIFNELSIDLNTLPPQASWSQYVGAWKWLLKKYLGISGGADEAEWTDSEGFARAEIAAILDRLAGLDAVQANVTLSDFSETLEHWLERSTVAAPPVNAAGVTVLSATAARGQPFRTLFILGLNEGVFPRTIREDAFLRDRDRETLERDLGFKVNPKLAGFDEEKLVFTLLVNAARERLYCLFQRSDESGRVLAPSWYLTELRRALGSHAGHHLEETTIPRSIADKARTGPFDRDDLLLPEELAVRLSLENRDPTTLIEAFDLSPALYKQGRQVAERLELTSAALDAFDGVVGPLSDYWCHFSGRGISPTALETYSRCPFQFFARHVLGLERLERPEAISGPSAAEFGELGHLILRSIYQEFIHQDYFAGKAAAATDIDATLKTVAQRAFAEYASKNPVGYPLAWEILQESLTELLRQVLVRDLQEISVSGYTPVAFEVDAKEQLGPAWPEPLNGQTIRGRMDRIDRDRTRNRLRVIDYKFKLGVSSGVQDQDLYRAALRGEKLQPPFYFLLGKRWAAEDKIHAPAPDVEANFYYIAPRWSDGPLVTASFASEGFAGSMGEEMRSTISYLAQGIQNGRFFIQPGDYCRHCDVAEICRKSHPPSLWRTENDRLTEPHRQLREKDPKKL